MTDSSPESQTSAGIIPFISPQRAPDQFLVLNYPQGHWGVPKGHVEAGETLQETAIRELREETSIVQIELITGFNYSFDYQFEHQDKLIDKTVHCFAGHVQDTPDTVVLSHEHEQFDWLEYEQTIERLTYDNERSMLNDFYTEGY